MARPAGKKLNEKALSKGQMRKLTALRKSLGDEIGEKAFAAWLEQAANAPSSGQVDKNAQLIAETLGELVNSNKLRIPRGGYLISRGRKRVIVTRPES